MAYQGISPYLYRNNLTNVQLLDDISGSFNGTTTQFNLTTNGSPFHAVSARSLVIVLGGIIQEPDADYTVNAGVITFTTAPASGLTFAGRNIYGLNAINNVNDGVITPAKLTTGGPSWDMSGNLTITGDLISNSLGDVVNLASIDKSIADTAVDIFVYDTRKDSDGGAWRKRTQHTSWYNETLNTATRGGRREFPAVAVLVLEEGKLTIYDGDDPDLPMWMVFNKASDYMLFNVSSNGRKLTALNGHVALANSDALFACSFIDDRGYLLNNANTYESGNILGRNSGYGYNVTNADNQLISSSTYDVAMTVLPNAPIDPATGLPIPTIAVATSGGPSIIKDDGTVVDLRLQNTYNVQFTDDYKLVANINTHNTTFSTHIYDVIPSTDSNTFGNRFYYRDAVGGRSTPPLSGNNVESTANETRVLKDNLIAIPCTGNVGGTIPALNILQDNSTSQSNAMVAYVRPDYNTGWMHGDIKGAFLADTDATNVTGTELITNGTFDSDTSGWTADNATLSVVSGRLRVTNTGSNGEAYQQFTVEAGKTYVLSLECFTGTAGASYFLSTSAPNSYTGGIPYEFNITGVRSVTFIASSSTLFLRLEVTSSSVGDYAEFDNVSLRLAEEDRSVNNKGLQVFGTITKSPVATGAELVAYSGFSNSTNYLKQPFNSDLAIGNSDFSSVGWFKKSTSSNTGMILYANDGADQTFDVRVHTDLKMLAQITDDGFTTREIVNAQGPTVNDNLWHQYHVVRRSNVLYLYLDGNLLGTSAAVEANITNPLSTVIGAENLTANQKAFEGSLSLIRFSKSAPSPEQIKKIYEDEKVLFQENAKCTLYGSSDSVTALSYDDTTNLLHVGTSSGRSDFQGLRRINNTTTAVTTAISASNGLISEQ